VSGNEEKYSAYVQYVSNLSQNWALFSGFTFTAITVLLTLLPDPSQIFAQGTLFSLTALLFVFLFLLLFENTMLTYCVIAAPSLPKVTKIVGDLLLKVVWYVIGIPIVLMYLLWNLFSLAIAAIVLNAIFIILVHVAIDKPLEKDSTKKEWIRK